MSKKILLLILVLCGMSSIALAAEKNVRKVPFLPYIGTETMQFEDGSVSARPFSGHTTSQKSQTVFFDAGSTDLRQDQLKKIERIGKWLEANGGPFYTVVYYTTPDISMEIAQQRAQVVISALSDFKVGEPILTGEFRRQAVINPNRVEIRIK